jgi:hypothetical protein
MTIGKSMPSARSRAPAPTLEPDIFVLELGVGVGLFARYFLDAFRHRSAAEGKDYYERLPYVAGQKQSEILAHVANRHKQELQLQANRLNRYTGKRKK